MVSGPGEYCMQCVLCEWIYCKTCTVGRFHHAPITYGYVGMVLGWQGSTHPATSYISGLLCVQWYLLCVWQCWCSASVCKGSGQNQTACWVCHHWGLLREGGQLERNTSFIFLCIQVLFSLLFHLPSPPQVPVCYGSIFIELCKIDPATFPQIVSSLYEKTQS